MIWPIRAPRCSLLPGNHDVDTWRGGPLRQFNEFAFRSTSQPKLLFTREILRSRHPCMGTIRGGNSMYRGDEDRFQRRSQYRGSEGHKHLDSRPKILRPSSQRNTKSSCRHINARQFISLLKLVIIERQRRYSMHITPERAFHRCIGIDLLEWAPFFIVHTQIIQRINFFGLIDLWKLRVAYTYRLLADSSSEGRVAYFKSRSGAHMKVVRGDSSDAVENALSL